MADGFSFRSKRANPLAPPGGRRRERHLLRIPERGEQSGNAYALIFVPDSPLGALTQAQIDKLAYAGCSPGGMVGTACMTGTSAAGYGSDGTMGGYPASQVITNP